MDLYKQQRAHGTIVRKTTVSVYVNLYRASFLEWRSLNSLLSFSPWNNTEDVWDRQYWLNIAYNISVADSHDCHLLVCLIAGVYKFNTKICFESRINVYIPKTIKSTMGESHILWSLQILSRCLIELVDVTSSSRHDNITLQLLYIHIL